MNNKLNVSVIVHFINFILYKQYVRSDVVMDVLARNDEIKQLTRFFDSNSAEFLALYGRRRVGKTFLIRTFFAAREDCVFFNVTGAKDVPMKTQIKHFSAQLSEAFYGGVGIKEGANWDESFAQLTKAMRDQVSEDKKVILFFDELPWMATRRARVLEMLDYYWNQHWSFDKRVKLIICGSSASWIINKVINNRGGLHNRVTREMHLESFNLSEMKTFLHAKHIQLNERQILQLYLVTGGVPFYLTKIERGLSATQIIESLAFSKTGFLLEEFDKLFSSLFDHSHDYIMLVKLLAENRYGIGERELLTQVGKKAVGAKGKKMLDDLEKTGFILSFKPLYNLKKGIYYRLTDEYTLFYLKWIEPLKSAIAQKALEPNYWQAVQNTPEWYSWQGYAFESVCYKHLIKIRRALKLAPTALPSTWRYVPKPGANQRGAQIDLLFDRKDDAITLCEIKYTDEPFVLTKAYVDTIHQKIAVFKSRTRTQKQIFVAFISANGVKNNYYADNLITQVVTLQDLFDM